ncbi:MAG: hypothetical protein EAZ89_01035 [Bacteroidetes bacterium]|nr:MAG: hypothetical protein EAZ89_01035 [Bacteroidota bacterium]
MSAPLLQDPNQLYPFLYIQRNAIMNTIRNKDFVQREDGTPFLYRKPSIICEPTGDALARTWIDKNKFAQAWKNRIERNVESFGLKLTKIEDWNTPDVLDFLNRRYPPELAKEICAFDLYRFRKYGHGIVLFDKNKEIQGTIFEEGYDTLEKTSFTLRMAVSESLEGRNLGYNLMMYSCLTAMEQGSRVKRGLIQVNNLRSLHINLNKVGWICEKYIEITGLGSFFEIALPLDPMGMTSNIIEPSGIREFLRLHRKDQDYRLVSAESISEIKELYSSGEWKVVALAGKSAGFDNPMLLALSPERISFQSW